jgi:Ca2+-binding RTX toxin-like protein
VCNQLEGEAGDDTLVAGDTWSSLDGGVGNDRLLDGAGGDFLAGGPGADTISGGGGDDVVKARDGFRDRIRCGGGRDFVLADRQDVVARDCERVVRPRRR